ncbi:MAG: transposase family protein [Candidatus Thermoplasmatota archaeon]|nr:transposase family protein [Candidatus Thermoplasmatota archaeon]
MSTFPSGRANDLRLKTDGGSQFTSTALRDGCILLGITLEAIKKRNPEGRTRISPLTAMFCCSSQPEGARSLAILK